MPAAATLTWPYDIHNPYHPDGKLREYAAPNRAAMDRFREQYGLVSFTLPAGSKVRIRLMPTRH